MQATPRLGDLLRNLLDRARLVGCMPRTPEAREMWAEVYPSLTTVPEGGVLGAVLGRGEAQTLRISLLMALLAGRDEVAVPDLQAALDLWKYCADSARLIFAPAAGIEGANLGHRLVEAVRAAGPAGIARTALAERFHVRKNNHEAFVLELARAKSRGEIESVAEGTAGRPKEVWRAVGDPYPALIRHLTGTAVAGKVSAFSSGNTAVLTPPDPFPAFPAPDKPSSQKPVFDLSKPLAPGRYSL